MKFTWDPDKYEENIRKHHISFKEARTIFLDEHMIRWEDDNHTNIDATEDRFYALGKSIYNNIILVCFCERFEDTIRIYSARKAKKEEKEDYYASY